eukprot:716826-Amphidinium_carterae.1
MPLCPPPNRPLRCSRTCAGDQRLCSHDQKRWCDATNSFAEVRGLMALSRAKRLVRRYAAK